MDNQLKRAFVWSLLFYLIGIFWLIVGGNGSDLAVYFSGLGNADSWFTSPETINAFIMIPTIIGISLLLLGVSTFTVSFYVWLTKKK